MNIKVGVSNRHIHLCKEDYEFFFGNIEFTKFKDLSQNGEFASNLLVTIKTEKNEIKNVRIIGPLRKHSQAEISKTDSYKLGINPPIRMSRDFNGAVDVTLKYLDKEKVIKNSCIIANRHLHVNSSDLKKFNMFDGKKVRVKILGDRGGILDNIIVKSQDNYNLELHLDTDEANAFNLKNGDEVILLGDEEWWKQIIKKYFLKKNKS